MVKNLKESIAQKGFVPPSFDENKSLSCHLSVLVSSNYSEACIFHIPSGKYIGLVFCNNPINNLIKEFSFLLFDYKSTSIAVNNKTATLVPSEFYAEENLKEYCSINFDFTNQHKPKSNFLKELNVYNCFLVEENIEKELNKHFSNYTLLHATTPFLELQKVHSKNSNEGKVFANLCDDILHLVYFKKNDLQFSNTFSVSTKEDVAYYIVNLYDTEKLNATKIPLYLSGLVQNSTIELLEKYILNVRAFVPTRNMQFSETMTDVEHSKYINLYSQYLCV